MGCAGGETFFKKFPPWPPEAFPTPPYPLERTPGVDIM